MGRIELGIDETIDTAFPAQRAARVTMETKDGRREHFFQSTRKGDPDQPLTDGELEEKFLELIVPVIGRPKALVLLERLWRLDAGPVLDLH